MSEDDHENQAPDNLEKLNSEYHYIYKEIQGSIKDKVISKFLSTIQQQSKELIELKKENTMLKNQLTYILKRILLNKSDFNTAVKTTRINNLNNSLYYNKSMIVNNTNKKSNSSMLRPLRSVENYRVVSDNFHMDSMYNKNRDNNSSVNILGNESGGYVNTTTSVDNKVSGYLNSLYRHNFNNGNRNNYFLNSKNSLIEDLFPNKNNSYYINTENDSVNNVYGTNIKQKNNVKKDLSIEKRPNKKKIGTNKSAERRNKFKFVDISSNSVKKRKKNYLKNNDKIIGKNNYNTINNINNENQIKKNKPKKIQVYPKRSPFIANKF